MKVLTPKNQQEQSFRSSALLNATANLEERVFLNKALLDICGSDIPNVVMANNGQERRERFNRASLGFFLAFMSPFLTLPIANRFAMKRIAKLTPKFFSKESKAIGLSNKFLINAEETKKGLSKLSEHTKTDFQRLLEKVGGDYEKLRCNIIKAKTSVIAFDIAITSGALGGIGFINNYLTKKKTGQSGFSAEFKMADKETIEKRASTYEKNKKYRVATFIAGVGLISSLPFAIKKGLSSNKINKFTNFIKKHADKFDYNDSILMKRLPLFLTCFGGYLGVSMASRNKTELKDNVTRATFSNITFFGGDILFASLLGRLSDKLLKTQIIKKDVEKPNSILNKLIPPTRPLKELEGKSRPIGIALFWLNFIALSGMIGFGTPYLINKMIKRDVDKDINKSDTKDLKLDFIPTDNKTFSKLKLK